MPKSQLIDNPVKEESHLAKKELAKTINQGLSKLHTDNKCEFVWLTGGDLIFPTDYTLKIVQRMQKDSSVISSGVIKNEFSIEPRGGGRIVDWNFWKKIGMLYPVNYGWEGYLVLKANSLGYVTNSYSDLLIDTQRKSGTKFDPKKYYYYGLALKALGYTFSYTMVKILLFARKRPKSAFFMFKGYISNYDQLYEKELREFVRKTQSKNKFSVNYMKRFFQTLSSK